jgi:hypothetical protein
MESTTSLSRCSRDFNPQASLHLQFCSVYGGISCASLVQSDSSASTRQHPMDNRSYLTHLLHDLRSFLRLLRNFVQLALL